MGTVNLCFDIGGSFIKAGLSGSDGAITPIGQVPTPGDEFDAFVGVLTGFLRGAGADTPARIAVSIAGVIDPDTQRVRCANIPCIDGMALSAVLSQRLGMDVLVANDADCFALAEALLGAGRGERIVFSVILGTGVGGGLVIDGRLLQGTGGLTGEWGHGPVADRHPDSVRRPVPRFACGCGLSGCIDTIGGARGLERLHQALHDEVADSHAILGRWLDGDAGAEETVACQVDLVSAALSLAVNLIGPGIVPVGGGLGSVPALVARLDLATRSRILRPTDRPLLVPGRCRQNPGLIGAGLLARQTL